MELIKHTSDMELMAIMPLGDIQYTGNDEDLAFSLLEKRIAYGLEIGAKFIGVGDYIDYCSPSNRHALRAAKVYDNVMKIHEDAATRLVDTLVEKLLAPTIGHWLGLTEGHHFFPYEDGTTTDMYLADILGTKFLGTSAFIRIERPDLKPVDIWVHHGAGGGQTAGAQMNKLDNVARGFEADIFLMGHWTRLGSVPVQRILPDYSTEPYKLVHKTTYLVATGGFSKGYIERSKQGIVARGSYVEQGMMRPAALGNPVVWLDGDEITVEY